MSPKGRHDAPPAGNRHAENMTFRGSFTDGKHLVPTKCSDVHSVQLHSSSAESFANLHFLSKSPMAGAKGSCRFETAVCHKRQDPLMP